MTIETTGRQKCSGKADSGTSVASNSLPKDNKSSGCLGAAGMRKVALILLLAATSPGAWAEWVFISESIGDDKSYIDPRSIKKDGKLRRAWVVTDYKGKRKNGVRSFRGLTEVDCKGKRLRILSYTSHSGPMATGELIGTGKPQPQWVKITSGTLGSNLFKYVCPK